MRKRVICVGSSLLKISSSADNNVQNLMKKDLSSSGLDLTEASQQEGDESSPNNTNSRANEFGKLSSIAQSHRSQTTS